MKRRGFSLIEITVVVLIIGIIAAVVVLRWEGPTTQARMRDVVDQVAAFDALTRDHAQQQDVPVRVSVDRVHGLIRWTEAQSAASPAVRLPAGYKIGQVRVRGANDPGGPAEVAFSRLGLSPTYALRLDGPGGRQQWVVILGLTGQFMEASDENKVNDILAAGPSVHAG